MNDDRVYTVEDFWDGPREGFATFRGRAYHFRCIFDEAADDWSDRFHLTPVSEEALAAAREAWQIWLRWEEAFVARKTTEATHPALPPDRTRYEQLKKISDASVDANLNLSFVARGDFRSSDSVSADEDAMLRVKWHVTAA
jgi:hypothetical protein